VELAGCYGWFLVGVLLDDVVSEAIGRDFGDDGGVVVGVDRLFGDVVASLFLVLDDDVSHLDDVAGLYVGLVASLAGLIAVDFMLVDELAPDIVARFGVVFEVVGRFGAGGEDGLVSQVGALAVSDFGADGPLAEGDDALVNGARFVGRVGGGRGQTKG